jgi:hypothetical protein
MALNSLPLGMSILTLDASRTLPRPEFPDDRVVLAPQRRLHDGKRAHLDVGEAGMPKVDDEGDAPRIGAIPDLVFERVLEREASALLPFARLGLHAHGAIAGNHNAEVDVHAQVVGEMSHVVPWLLKGSGDRLGPAQRMTE